MEIFGFEKDEDGNIFCNENGQKKQSFTAFSPYETKKVIFKCQKHGEVPCEVLIMNGKMTEPYCPICEQEEEKRKAEKELKDQKEREIQNQILQWKSMNIEKEYWGKTIDDYIPQCESQKKAQNAVRKLLEQKHGKVVLIGNNGCGKSHLGNAAVSALGGKVLTVYEVNAMIRQSYSLLAKQTELEIVEDLASVPMLFLDEFGRSKGSKFNSDWLSFVLDKRHQRGLPFILAGNGHLRKDCPHGEAHCEDCFENYLGEDILSRLRQDTEVITLYNAPDYRRKK